MRSIDPDQVDTFYTDSSGGSAYWYRHTYCNETTLEETELAELPAWRGSDFAHYAPLSAIRTEAGFDNAVNLTDQMIDQQRRAAEAEMNTALGEHHTLPFTRPLPATRKEADDQARGRLPLDHCLRWQHSRCHSRRGRSSADVGLEDRRRRTGRRRQRRRTWRGRKQLARRLDSNDADRRGGGERIFRIGSIW